MEQQIKIMLKMQDDINHLVHPQWRQQQFKWYRAIWIECAEALDYLGWKWWKKQSLDAEQVKLELVDIWHFGLSSLLETDDRYKQLAGVIAKEYEASSKPKGDVKLLLEQFTADTLLNKHFRVSLFFSLMRSIDLSMEQLFKTYVGKNTLNRFRQDNGYLQGSYRKQWRGRDDNEHLIEIMAQLDCDRQDFVDLLYQKLQALYSPPQPSA